MAWRYIVQRLPDRTFAHWDAPLRDVQITSTLSGPGRLTATLDRDTQLVDVDGQPLLRQFGAAVWAEVDGQIRGGGIVWDVDTQGDTLTLDVAGVASYPKGMPWTAEEYVGNGVDPLRLVRMIWTHLQGQPGGDLGVTVDETTSPRRFGNDEDLYRLNTWSTHDLGREIDTLAGDTPFDYREHTTWDGDTNRLLHRLELGYPSLGGRRTDLRFALGENITVLPRLPEVDYASETLVVGAGEGQDGVRGRITPTRTQRLRRVAVVVDKTITSGDAARDRSRSENALRAGGVEPDTLRVRNTPNAPLGSWQVGDEIYLVGDAGWYPLNMWVRIIESTIFPARDEAELTVVRSERA